MAKNYMQFYLNPEWLLDNFSSDYETAFQHLFFVLSGNTNVVYGLSSYTDKYEYYTGAGGQIYVTVDKEQNLLTADIKSWPVQPGFMEAAKQVLINNLKLAQFQPSDLEIWDESARYVVRLSYKNNIEETGTLTINEAMTIIKTLDGFSKCDEILNSGQLVTVNPFRKDIIADHPRSSKVTVGNVVIIQLNKKVEKETKKSPVTVQDVSVDLEAVDILDYMTDLNDSLVKEETEIIKEKSTPIIKRRTRTKVTPKTTETVKKTRTKK